MSRPPSTAPSARVRHPWLYALPGAVLPPAVVCRGQVYRWVETFKHDFFAGTGLYTGPAGLAVLKMNRVNPLFGLPMEWAGRFLARREMHFYRAMSGVAGVPALLGSVGRTGFLHAYVPGHPLGRRELVSDTFFDELLTLVRTLHGRHVAYVDLNKRQNILVGDDGRPHLIDFQIALGLPSGRWRRRTPLGWLLARFQQGDVYHCLKHKRRLRPDLMTEQEHRVVCRVSIWIRLHRWVAQPLTRLRRRTLRHLHGEGTGRVAGDDAK